MKKKAKIFLAKLLITFSIVLIVLGVFLQFNGKVFHPITDVTVVKSDSKKDISITTVDDDNIRPIGGSQTGSSFDSEKKIQNKQLRDEIQKTYGVEVKFGTETINYSVAGMQTEAILDDTMCWMALNRLNEMLKLYPVGFFKEISEEGFPLTFYLIKRYSTINVTGVTDSSYRNIVISIATDYDFSDTFHHEVYHYIEKYIFSKGFKFTSWNSLNPGNFVYGVIDSKYSYAKTFSEKAFFVNSYAQTDEYEDRASTFEYMMKESKPSCLNYGTTVWLKAKLMCEQIDYFLDTVSPNTIEYWERYVY